MKRILITISFLTVVYSAYAKPLNVGGYFTLDVPAEFKPRIPKPGTNIIYFASVLGYGGGAIKILAITSPNPDYHLSESQLLRNIIPDDELVVMGLKKVKLNGIPAVVTTSQWLPKSVLHEIDLWFAGKKFTVQLAHADGDVPPWVDFIIESITPL